MEPVLRVEGLTKRYGNTTVLDNISFELPKGSVTLLTGRSGSGKSTLFKLLAGLDHATSGEIFLDEARLSGLSEEHLANLRLRRIGLVFQSLNLLPGLTALENVRLPLDLAGISRRSGEQTASRLLGLVGVEHRASARPNSLSGGEQQRVALARALTHRPALLLADEPTGSLDRKNAENVFNVLRDLNETFGTTMLIVTHDDLASRWFPSQLLLSEGRLTRQ